MNAFITYVIPAETNRPVVMSRHATLLGAKRRYLAMGREYARSGRYPLEFGFGAQADIWPLCLRRD